jgi:POT family proton-dependent oligopeptide transporter
MSSIAIKDPSHAMNQRQIFGHPIGLYILFFTELWERFSYYGMRAILTLYMISSISAENSGLGWTSGSALQLYGWYTMLVYILSIPGGILADKFIGQKKSVMIGGLILVAGHSILAIEQNWAFFTGLLLIVLGVGGLKPNISTMVGGLYPPGDERRDGGFTIFYIGINIGAFAASLAVGYVGETIGWHYGFGMAGVGMLIGQLVFMSGQRFLKGVGEPPHIRHGHQTIGKDDDESTSLGDLMGNLFRSPLHLLITIALIVVGIFSSSYLFEGYEVYAYGALFTFLSIAIGLMMMIYLDVNDIEKDRFLVLLISYLIVIVFWGAFEQAGGLMNIYTKQKIDRTVMGIDIPASVFQAVNPMFIIIFGTIVANFWLWIRHRGKEASSLFKMAIGTIVMGTGFIFMGIAAVQASSEVGAKGALVWLILAYLFHTLGELSASPVSLSFITKVAPVKYVSIMMGFYFAATGLGNKVAGLIGESSQLHPVRVELTASYEEIRSKVPPERQYEGGNFDLVSNISVEGNEIIMLREGKNVQDWINLSAEDESELLRRMKGEEEALTAVLKFEQMESGKYSAEVVIFELQNRLELRTFIMIFLFAGSFGVLLLIFLRKLKKLTHGADDGGSSE